MSSRRLRHLSEHRQRESHEEDDHQHGAQEGGGLARQEEAHEEAVVAEPHTVGDPGAMVVVVAHAAACEGRGGVTCHRGGSGRRAAACRCGRRCSGARDRGVRCGGRGSSWGGWRVWQLLLTG